MPRQSLLRVLLLALLSLSVEGVVTNIAAGTRHSCSLLTDGKVNCWGYGRGGGSATPVLVSGITTVARIALSGYSSCALLYSGKVTCWHDIASDTFPIEVSGIMTAKNIAQGLYYACAVLTDGKVKC